MKSKKQKISYRVIVGFAFVFLLCALILEMVPGAVTLPFASGPNQWVTKAFSCFSLTPFGYAEYLPLLTGIFTTLATVLCLIYLFKKAGTARLQTAALLCNCMALAANVLLMFKYGFANLSLWNALFFAALLLAAVLLVLSIRKQAKA